MRNLKRVLSLVLAVMMVIGMMVISTSAANTSFKDDEFIQYPEAVNLLSQLGVLNGGNDGNFSPKGFLQREQAAKIAYLLANRDQNYTNYVGTNTTLNDVKGNWAEGAIAWCAAPANGILLGNGSSYDPKGLLTVAQTEVIMLRVLGYDNTLEGFTGTGWEYNAHNKAIEIGLTDGLTGLVLGNPITREQAAQMAFNALFSSTQTKTYGVTVDGKRYVNGYSAVPQPALSLKTFDVVAVNATVDGYGTFTVNTIGDDSATDKTGAATAIKSVMENATTGYTASAAELGNNVTVYVKVPAWTRNAANGAITYNATTANVGKVSTDLVPAATSVIGTSAKGLGWAYLTTKPVPGAPNPYFVAEVDANAVYYMDGALDTGKTTTRNATAVAGNVVEFINNNLDPKADVVKVTTKKAYRLSADPIVTTKGTTTTVTISVIPGVANRNALTIDGYKDLKKGDVVLVSETADGKMTITKAEKVNGSISGTHSLYGALIGTSYYTASGITFNSAAVKALNNTNYPANKNFDFYLDDGGFVVTGVEVKEDGTTEPEPEKETGFLVVEDASVVMPASDGSLGFQASAYIQAKVVKADGTVETVTIDSVDGIKLSIHTTDSKEEDLVDGTADTHIIGHSAAISTLSDFNTAKYTTKTSAAMNYNNKTATTAGRFYSVWKDTNTTVGDGTAATEAWLGDFFTVSAAGKSEITALVTNNLPYTYTKVSDGHYAIANIGGTLAYSNAATNGQVTSNTPKFDGTNVGNADTVFLYAVTDPATSKVSYNTATGIANVPGTKNATGADVKVVNKGGVAVFAYVQTAKANFGSVAVATEDEGDLVYMTPAQQLSYTTLAGGAPGTPAKYVVKAYLNGVETEMTITTDPATLDTDGTVYPATVADGVYTLTVDQKVAPKATAGISANGGGVLVVNGTSSVYTYAADAEAFIVNLDGTCTPTTISALLPDGNDLVTVIEGTGGKALCVYVTKVSNEPVAPAFVTVSGGKAYVCVAPVDGTAVKSVTVNGVTTTKAGDGTFATGAGFTAAAARVTVVITVTDDNSKADEVFYYALPLATSAEPISVSISKVAPSFSLTAVTNKNDDANKTLSGAAHMAHSSNVLLKDGTTVMFDMSGYTNANREYAVYKVVLPATYVATYSFKIAATKEATGIAHNDIQNYNYGSTGTAVALDADHAIYVIVSNTTTAFQICVSNDNFNSDLHYFNVACTSWKMEDPA